MMDFTNTTKELNDSKIDTVSISIGSIEQFGPYLPMHIDCIIAELYANEFGKTLDAYVLPVFPFNTSEEHANYKGTVTISPNTLTTMLEEIIVNLSKQKFTKFVLSTGHGGAYWYKQFIKHMNYTYPEIIVISPMHNDSAWGEAIKASGFEGRNELHGGLLGVCTAMWLCPEEVKLEKMGKEVPYEMNKFADVMGWDKLTKDGNWGEFDPKQFEKEELAEKGETLWMTFIQKNCEGLKEYLEEAYKKKIGG
ncbi:creatininase family protein [Chengkuizengella axinellae]|uniref:Creatininase family protein n=1 Tax=Chengkuizengella axinellae TaxID=3064388 RepID=A0ABT9J1L5_9BACL|nr:creatininase family protein [Chengkuizengella sp. 2205SS18-9]MDP5275487.1 creatininase family protein [Chengkuizengella sp. 2205SS18-9]